MNVNKRRNSNEKSIDITLAIIYTIVIILFLILFIFIGIVVYEHLNSGFIYSETTVLFAKIIAGMVALYLLNKMFFKFTDDIGLFKWIFLTLFLLEMVALYSDSIFLNK
ncbi:hypothetical protein NKB77_004904 [Salmonella enterica]|nr:hypothetical protein [Salmonella enterica]